MESKITPIRRRPSVRDSFAILREQREPQIQMAEMVADCITGRKNAAIEAGTGTGKSFAYLLPVVTQGLRAVVSTFTIALQEQLTHKDIPFLQKALREKFGISFTAAMLKGSSNYLCKRRLGEVEVSLPAAIVQWGNSTKCGDLTEAPEMDAEIRDSIRIDLNDCDKQSCPFFQSCYYRKAKEAAKEVDVLIVNHKLFSMGLENPFLLDLSGFDVAIIDEAHQFEDVARDSFGGKLSPGMLTKFFRAVERFLVEEENEDEWNRIRDGFRAAWLGVISRWLPTTIPDDRLLVPVGLIRDLCVPASEALAAVSMWVNERLQDEPEHKKIGRQLDAIRGFFSCIQAGDVITVAARRFQEGDKFAKVTLETYPLFIGPRLQKSLYPFLPVIYCSATISANGSFALIKNALGLVADVPSAEIGSPFNYLEQSILYVPRGGFDPREQSYLAAFCRETETLLQMSQGRAFVLFTANKAMFEAYRARRHSFPSRWQEPGSNKNALIEWFKATPNAVLYATASFWEGVSIEGEALSLVIIDKIPFPPPSDPIYKAKAALMVGQKEFFALSVPSAIIKLKQGFGRLIRTQDDRGMVAILDSRIMGKGYGRTILNSLPPARLVHDLSDRALIGRYIAPAASDAESVMGW